MAAGLIPQDDGRVLDPIDRNSEILFGLFMVLTFTGTLSVATAGREEVRSMLLAAIGCNIAWGLVDAVMYVLRALVARGREAALVRAVQATSDPEEARRHIAGEMGPLGAQMGAAQFETLRQWLLTVPAPQGRSVRLTGRDLRGGLGVFLLVFGSTFPVVLPFVFITDARLALRISGAVAIAMLYLCGHLWGRYAGLRPWRVGLLMVLLGVVIQAVVIALGG
jgi:VIT1/CCC1 family predicted Fe2+/Mn2+ transporter